MTCWSGKPSGDRNIAEVVTAQGPSNEVIYPACVYYCAHSQPGGNMGDAFNSFQIFLSVFNSYLKYSEELIGT